MIPQDLEERLVDGLQSFAQLWFMEFTDETELPAEFTDLVALIDPVEPRWYHPLEHEEDDEDEEEGDG